MWLEMLLGIKDFKIESKTNFKSISFRSNTKLTRHEIVKILSNKKLYESYYTIYQISVNSILENAYDYNLVLGGKHGNRLSAI